MINVLNLIIQEMIIPLNALHKVGYWSDSVFDTASIKKGSMKADLPNEKTTFNEIERSPSDEFLLTELCWDDKNFKIIDISSMIMVGEQPDKANPFATFKCFVDEDNKEFFIEINASTPLKFFTRSTLLNLLDFAEKYGA